MFNFVIGMTNEIEETRRSMQDSGSSNSWTPIIILLIIIGVPVIIKLFKK